MTAHVQIRRACPRDFDALGRVFHAAVREAATAYSEAQRMAWSPAPRTGEAWANLLCGQHVWLAETEDRPLGFMTLTPEGYVDFAFILSEAQGHGVFRRLYTGLETQARTLGLTRLWTDASLHAKAPFEAMGFAVQYPEWVDRGGETLKRFRMEKMLDA